MNRIKDFLKDLDYTQTQLAQELGKSFNMVNSYCQNRRQPDIETLYRIAQILDIDVRDLLVSNKTQKTN